MFPSPQDLYLSKHLNFPNQQLPQPAIKRAEEYPSHRLPTPHRMGDYPASQEYVHCLVNALCNTSAKPEPEELPLL